MKQGNIKGYPRFFSLQHRASNPFQAMRVHQISAKLTKPFMVLFSWKIKTHSSMYWVDSHPVDSTVGFANSYPLNTVLSVGQPYPPFEKLGCDLESSQSFRFSS